MIYKIACLQPFEHVLICFMKFCQFRVTNMKHILYGADAH
jgi:hypothetical protein